MKPKLFLFFLAFIASTSQTWSQRNYYFFDSTSYSVSQDIKLIASKFKLYAQDGAQLKLLKDFKSTDTNYYIRDVDFIDRNNIWVLVGRNTIGYPTQLFKSVDGGENWSIDSSFYNVSEHRSLNQMQVLNKDTLILFDGYYQSDVLRSFDQGKTWHNWISSLIAHYFQLHYCQQKNSYHMIGLPGDAFSSVSFEIPDSVWRNASNKNWYSGCHNKQPWCHRVSYGQNIWQVNFIQEHQLYIDSICENKSTSILEPHFGSNREILIYPNPAQKEVMIEYLKGETLEIYSLDGIFMGRQVVENSGKVLIDFLPSGIYLIRFNQYNFRLVKE
jgi:hypothetical protein